MDDYHVYPLNDLVYHILEGEGCPCLPRIEYSNGQKIIIHVAWDGREAGEYLADKYDAIN